MITIPYLIIGLLVFLVVFVLKERQEMSNKLARKCLDYHKLEGQLEDQFHMQAEIKHLSKEVAESYHERLKLERQLEHLATGPNAIYRDNIQLRKRLQEDYRSGKQS